MDPQAAKQQFVERVKNATNVLVTVSKDPSVDQLAAALGFTLMLNKMSKHGSAVVSGIVPQAMQFLDPSKTFDDSVDSLRDFVISLSTEKADKLRYKKEDGVVKIFITPYKTKLSQDDFEFTQGDFNVDVVVALGVQDREHLDEAIRAHGRILHDATVITINNDAPSNLGSIDWTVPEASSLSEMLVSVSEAFEGGILDAQMSTAFLTGIVAATDRFRNKNTSPKVMTMAAQLMAAGANQQLVATNLESALDKQPAEAVVEPAKPQDPATEDVALPPVASDEQVANDINAMLNEAEQNLQSGTEQTPDDQPPAEPAVPAVPPQGPADLATDLNAASLTDLEAELASLADGVKPQVPDVVTQNAFEDHVVEDENKPSIDLPSTRSLDLNTDASDALPIVEQTQTLPVSEPRLPNADDVISDLNPSPPQRPSDVGLVAPSETPTGDQVQTSSIISDAKSISQTPIGPEPALGGTFNATSQDAAEAKMRENNASVNNAILSHKAPPTDQANMTNDQVQFGTSQPPQISTNPQPMQTPEIDLDAARRAVEDAAAGGAPAIDNNPIQSLNAQEMLSDSPLQFGQPQPDQPVQPQQPVGMPPLQPPAQMQQPMPPQQPQVPQFGPQMQQPPQQPQNMQANSFALPQQPQQGPGPLAPPPPPPGGSAPVIAPKVSPANLGSFAPAQPQQPQQMQPPQQPQQPQFGMPPAPGNAAPPPAPIQFDATPPPQGPQY